MGASGAGILILVIVFLVATRLVPQGRKFLNDYHKAQLLREPAQNPAAGTRGTSGPRFACPTCGGTEFEPRPSRTAPSGTVDTGHLTGIPGALGIPTVPKQMRVACMTCGVHYDRG